MSITPLNQSAFETEIGRSKQPAVCLFWAGFCKPCRKMTDTVMSIERRLGELGELYGGSRAECHDTAADMVARLKACDIHTLFQSGLHEFIGESIVTVNQLSNQISRAYHF